MHTYSDFNFKLLIYWVGWTIFWSKWIQLMGNKIRTRRKLNFNTNLWPLKVEVFPSNKNKYKKEHQNY
jgi:hypothetical protein